MDNPLHKPGEGGISEVYYAKLQNGCLIGLGFDKETLKIKLQEAIDCEDYEEAARLKIEIDESCTGESDFIL